MVSLTFYGGAETVGGNKFLVEDGDTRFFLDFGTDYELMDRYFEEFLPPRSSRGLLDHLEVGLLPPLEGLYRGDLEHAEDAWQRYRGRASRRKVNLAGRVEGREVPYEDWREKELKGVLLSHGHLDHAGALAYLRGDIPIHCSPLTACILKANQDTGRSGLQNEFCYTKERQAQEGIIKATRGAVPSLRPLLLTQEPWSGDDFPGLWSRYPLGELGGSPPTASPGRIGPLAYRSWPLDHSLMGATAFAVETSAGWLVYTGDLRRHGRWGQRTRDFLAQASQLRPTALLCEGTNAGEGHRVSEEEVADHGLRAVRESRGLVVADFGPRNIERLLTFLHIARETGRRLVILPKDVYLLEAMRCASPDIPSPQDEPGLFLYQEGKGRRDKWEQQVLARFPRQVQPEEVGRHPQEHILCFSFWDITKLIDVAPQGGTYIYSSSEAFSEDMEIDLDRLRAWLDHFGIRALGLGQRGAGGRWEIPPQERGYHASGHASGPDLLEMVQEIAPRVLVPIHTQRPSFYRENLQRSGIEVHLPRTGERMRLP